MATTNTTMGKYLKKNRLKMENLEIKLQKCWRERGGGSDEVVGHLFGIFLA